MDIIKFKTGEALPVDFPFDGMCELMGDRTLIDYLSMYSSLPHQVKVLEIGLKYGARKNGQKFEMTSADVRDLAFKNPHQIKEVFDIYDQNHLAHFLKVYFRGETEEAKEELTEQEKKENEEAVKN